jgi:hypothetical protein
MGLNRTPDNGLALTTMANSPNPPQLACRIQHHGRGQRHYQHIDIIELGQYLSKMQRIYF